jgi:AraC-like DNA-binding protein/streptogramin lyase
VTVIFEDKQGGLLLGTAYTGLGIRQGERFGRMDSGDRLNGESVTAICQDREGVTWIGTDGGLYTLKQGNLREYTDAAGQKPESVRSLWTSPDGSLWIGSDGEGLYCQRDNRLSKEPASGELENHFIYALLEDHEGGLWLGTYTEGLLRLTRKRVSGLLRAVGPGVSVINTLLVDHEGFLWAGTRKGGLLKIRDGEIKKIYTTVDGLVDRHIRALEVDRQGNLWVGSAGAGIQVIGPGGILATYNRHHGLASDRINVIFRDRSGTVWVGSDRGLDGIVEGQVTAIRAFPGLAVKVIEEAPRSGLWIGTAEGLFSLNNNRALPVMEGQKNQKIDAVSLYEDPTGTLWIGTNGDGLFCLKEERLLTFTVREGLTDNYIFSIREDRDNRLWMSSNQGIFFVSKDELLSFDGSRASPIRCVSLDEADGMLNRQCAGGSQPAAWQTGDGKIFYPTVRGIAVIDPAAIRVNAHPPPVVIDRVIADNAAIKGLYPPVLSQETSLVEFYFTAGSFRNPRKVKFKYRLEGYEEEWRETETGWQRTALYVNLPPGQYRFRVTAANNDGVWNREGAEFKFRIGSGSKIHVVLLAAVLLMAAGGGFYWHYRKRFSAQKPPGKYKTSALTAERAAELAQKLLEVMETEKNYLNPNLTLKELSEKLMVHPNYLSQIINEKLEQSFNDFINRYRIEAAKKKLQDPKKKNKTVLEIAYDTGFYSKSVFNTAFKKFTGMTPSQFRQKQTF